MIGVLQEKYKKVRKKVKTKTGKIYHQNQLDEDAAAIEKFYKDSGYLNIEVEGPVITYDETHSFMYVTFFVEEGSKYFLDNISFRGNIRIPDKDISEAIKIQKKRFLQS